MLCFESLKKVYLPGPRVFDRVRNSYKGQDIQLIAWMKCFGFSISMT